VSGRDRLGRGGLRAAAPLVAGALLLLAADPAAAAGGGPGLSETWLGLPRWVWATLNLLIFWGVLLRFVLPLARNYFVGRGKAIREELELARRQRAEAEGMRDELALRLAELEKEMAAAAARSEEESARERERILEQAAVDRDKIVQQAGDEITNRLASARAELIELTALLAADLARDEVVRRITPEDRRRIFERSLQRLEEKVS
jgi:F-type H+-transporting ATPase subunit b